MQHTSLNELLTYLSIFREVFVSNRYKLERSGERNESRNKVRLKVWYREICIAPHRMNSPLTLKRSCMDHTVFTLQTHHTCELESNGKNYATTRKVGKSVIKHDLDSGFRTLISPKLNHFFLGPRSVLSHNLFQSYQELLILCSDRHTAYNLHTYCIHTITTSPTSVAEVTSTSVGILCCSNSKPTRNVSEMPETKSIS